MIKQEIYLERARGWEVIAFYAVTHYEVDEIMRSLEDAGAKGRNLQTAYENLSSGKSNTGLCFSGEGKSVIVISVASSASQFVNSMFHEVHHLSCHIADQLGYDLMGEDVCYLSGEIAEKMYPIASKFMCEHCREH